jgi:ABC-type polysaccharide/polyol phosphate transport system ATPase subunit
MDPTRAPDVAPGVPTQAPPAGGGGSPAAVVVQDLGKRYRFYRSRYRSLREVITHGSFGQWEELWALTDVSFEVPQGQFLGVIGHNGSGKSTLLKVLARILRPDRGHVRVRGRVSSLLELGAGFHPEYSGRENVFLYGALLGLRRREIARRYSEIVEFSGLGDFIDYPVKNYSVGMYMRLGFAVAVQLEPDVLLVDEVLAVGDATFQERCYERLHQLRRLGCTIVLVSHDLEAVGRFCERAIWLDRGRVVLDGTTHGTIRGYLERAAERASAAGRGGGPSHVGEIEIVSVRYLTTDGRETRTVQSGSPLRVEIGYRAGRAVPELGVGVTIFRNDGLRCLDAPLRTDSVPEGAGSLILEFPRFGLRGGLYDLTIAFSDRGRVHQLHQRLYPFTVRDDVQTGAVLDIASRWRLDATEPR